MKTIISKPKAMSFYTSAMGSLGLKITASGFGFVNSVLLARILGPSDYGKYAIYMSLLIFMAQLLTFGLPMLITREVATLKQKSQWSRLKSIIKISYSTVYVNYTLCCASSSIIIIIFYSNNITIYALMILYLIMLFNALNQIRCSILRGLNKIILADMPEFIIQPIVMLSGIILLYIIVQNTFTIITALNIYLVSVFFTFLAGTIILKHAMPNFGRKDNAVYDPKSCLINSLSYLGITLIGTLTNQITLYLVGYLGSSHMAGLFHASMQLAGLIGLGLVSVNLPLQPKIAAAWACNNRNEVIKLISESTKLGTVISIIACIFVMFFAENILSIFGDRFIKATNTIRILAVAQLINAILGPYGLLIAAIGQQHFVMIINLLSLALNILICSLLIPYIGLHGAALAILLSVLLRKALYLLYVKIILNITPFRWILGISLIG